MIGNPPYIRQEIIPLKDQIESEFGNFFNRRADIFTYFFAKGLQVLKPNGILSFITSNKWARAGYGTPLRKLILSNTFSSYIDFNGVKAFNATVDTSITTLLKASSSDNWCFPTFTLQENQDAQKVLDNEKEIFSLLKSNSTSMAKTYLQEDCFVFESTQLLTLKKKIESIGTPLKDWDISINYGIKTGYNEAFIIDTTKREEILNNCQSQEEREATEKLIVKMLRGRDIKRYSYEWAGLWIIALEFGSHKYLQEKHPSIYSHLLQYQDALKARGQCTNKPITDKKPYLGQHHWLELDNNPTKEYLESFAREKIVYPETSQGAYFSYDPSGLFLEKTAFMINAKSFDTKCLLAFLNSDLATFYFKRFCSGCILGEKGYQYNKHALEKLPIPKIDSSNEKTAKTLVSLVEKIILLKEGDPKADTKKLENEIDELVYQLYNLTPEEIKIIKGEK